MNDWDGDYYQESAVVQEASALRILDNIAFKGNENVLDIGCGDGKVSQEIAKRVPEGKVIGIDVSPNMIQVAQSTHAAIPNLSFFQKDAQDFSFDQKFDLITSFFTLHWVQDHAAVLRNCQQSLHPGGRIVFFMPAGSDERIERVFSREPWGARLAGKQETFHSININLYQPLLDKFGFIVDELKILPLRHTFKTLDELVQFFMTWVPFYTGFDDKSCLQLSQELAQECVGGKNGSQEIALSTDMLYVNAVRQ